LGIVAALLIAAIAAPRDAAAQAGPGADPHANLPASERVGDVPAGPATISGTVVHRARPEAAGGLRIVLFALGADGRPGKRNTQTDAGGAFAFEKVSNDPRTVYLLAVQYGEVPFGARTVFRAGQLESSSVIEISDTRADGSDLAVGAVRLRIDRGCDGARITEAHMLHNPTDFIIQVPAAQRGLSEPLFRIEIPAGATAFTPGRGTLEESLQQLGDEVAFWGPVHPGSQDVEFAYSIPGATETLLLERSFPRGAEKVEVLTWAGGSAPRGEGLRSGPEVSVDGVPYASVESAALAPGQSVAFALDLGAFEPSGERLTVREVHMWLELDDAALDVREQYELSVSGSAPLRSESDAPLLCLPLPAGAEDLRSAEAFSLGIQPDVTGGLALRGPIPQGSSGFSVSYRLRSSGGGIRFVREFPIGLPLLSLMIADTGIQTSTDRLHRRRPVRTSDRTYIHLEGFEIEPGETVEVGLQSIPPRQPLPRLAAVGFVATAAVAAVVFLAAPLRNPRETAAVAASVASVASTADEREAVYATIRDLEDDFATGKVSAEDRAVMLGELRSRAGALLREERAAAAALANEAAAAPPPPAVADASADAPEVAAAACPGCGASIGSEARFCSRCGAQRGPETTGEAPPE
jgi:hypothetical protein